VLLSSETRASEDVAIYAADPQAHLFHGTPEQNVIYHVMKEAQHRTLIEFAPTEYQDFPLQPPQGALRRSARHCAPWP
jgi:hypothetical protein